MKPASGRTILAVDDEPGNLKLLRAVLRPEGYAVEIASSGREALHRLASGGVDLVLLDVMMPGMDGFEVCRRIRSDASISYIPIIFLTAMAVDQEGVIHGLDIGADDYVKKPFDSLELISRIRAALRVKVLHDKLRRANTELSRYVSLATLQMVERGESDMGTPVGKLADVTVLFSDIRGFTHIAEDKDPAEVFLILNRLLSAQLHVILAYHGVVDKLSGDEIMAVFEGPDMGENALACGAAIVEVLQDQERLSGADWTGVGIGINSGPVFVGSVGSEVLRDFTVVGNTVNIAARLCGKADRFQVLFTGSTRNLLGSRRHRFHSMGPTPLRGVTRPVSVFELVLPAVNKPVQTPLERD